MADIEVTFRRSWVNAAWYRAFCVPYVEVDGVVHVCDWRTPTRVPAAPGDHGLRTFVRYRRGIPGDLGNGRTTVTVPVDEVARVTATNGPLNSNPFVPRQGPGAIPGRAA